MQAGGRSLSYHQVKKHQRKAETRSIPGRLAVFESRRENDCMVKYLVDEYRGTTAKNYAIGLKALDNYAGVYEWHRVDDSAPNFAATLKFSNWSPAAPTGKGCVFISVGEGNTVNGLWQDVECTGSNLYGICEYEPTSKSGNNTGKS